MQYLRRRLLQTLVGLAGIIFIVFVVLRLSGEPAALLLPPNATDEAVEEFRRSLGLDRPIIVQFAVFAAKLARGDFGDSIYYRDPAGTLVLQRFPATLELAAAAMVLAVVIGVSLGIAAARRHGSRTDYLAITLSLLGQSMPIYWFGSLLIILFSVQLKLLPTSGRGSWQHIVLPAITLATFMMPQIARLTRSGLLDVLRADYIRTARSQGIDERTIVYKYALRNVAISLITVLGLQIGTLIGGAVITETVFAWPGVGSFTVEALYRRDYPVVMAAVTLVAVAFVVINFVVDVLYVVIDPRVRLGAGRMR